MAFPFESSSNNHPFTASTIIEKTKEIFKSFPDNRKLATSNNLKYSVADAAMSAFGAFFTQSPSFLDYQIRMQKKHGKNNGQTIFGIHKLPSANQVRNLLDPVSPEKLYPLLSEITESLYQHGYLKNFTTINDTLLIAVDGTDLFSSEKISCPYCTQQKLKNGKTLYRHTAVTPVIVAPGQSDVIPLPPEFVRPQDGKEKQDCELNAAKRWLDAWGKQYSPWGITLLGDDIYCHQPLCEEAISRGFQVLFVCKPDSHRELYEWLSDFERSNHICTMAHTRWNGKQRLTESYRYMNQVPLRDSDDTLMLNWCELTITDAKGQITYKNAWATTHLITDENVAEIATAGRTRWKVENENNNILKNQGYHFDHNFGHGKQHLSNLLATLIILAYLLHTVLNWMDTTYHTVRSLLPSRRTFFEHLRALIQYFLFDSWEHLMNFMLDGLDTS